jgi:hypothetical protein
MTSTPASRSSVLVHVFAVVGEHRPGFERDRVHERLVALVDHLDPGGVPAGTSENVWIASTIVG